MGLGSVDTWLTRHVDATHFAVGHSLFDILRFSPLEFNGQKATALGTAACIAFQADCTVAARPVCAIIVMVPTDWSVNGAAEVNIVSDEANAILEAAMQLPESERLLLASQIMDSLPEEDLTISVDDPDLLAELDRRFADPDGAVPWSELEAED